MSLYGPRAFHVRRRLEENKMACALGTICMALVQKVFLISWPCPWTNPRGSFGKVALSEVLNKFAKEPPRNSPIFSTTIILAPKPILYLILGLLLLCSAAEANASHIAGLAGWLAGLPWLRRRRITAGVVHQREIAESLPLAPWPSSIRSLRLCYTSTPGANV